MADFVRYVSKFCNLCRRNFVLRVAVLYLFVCVANMMHEGISEICLRLQLSLFMSTEMNLIADGI